MRSTSQVPYRVRPSEHLRRQGDDPHVVPVPQFTRHRPKDTGTPGHLLVVDDHRGVLVEPDGGTVRAPDRVSGADHHRPDDLTLLDEAAGNGLLDRRHDHIADAGVAAAGSPKDANAKE